MATPTKADLAAAVAKLTEENAGLRELLAAVSLAADTVPVSKDSNLSAEWQRSTRVLANIKGLSDLSDWPGYLAWAAGELRSIAAEPPGYEAYEASAEQPAALDGPDTAPHPRAGEDACPAVRTDEGLTFPCAVKPAVHLPGVHADRHSVYWFEEPRNCSAYQNGYRCVLTAAEHGEDERHGDELGNRWLDSEPEPSGGGVLFPSGCDPDAPAVAGAPLRLAMVRA
jgi:hypothetical protein